jgi:hypothetical protein
MEKKYFSLGTNENNNLVNIIRIVFGVVCIAVAIFWIIFNINSLKVPGNLWITVLFLTGFGSFQIWAGFGRTNIFIEIDSDHIRLKKNPVLPAVIMYSCDIEKIEIFPLNVVFRMKQKKKIRFRFGTTYHDINDKVKDEIQIFSESNNIPIEFILEKL